mmetsp:Transcript_70311/g.103014  ORF Transcript_70311/g.103014 Transcript_70311/m.103014 type:complete len:275 (-) Transcript_70311:42-866(-)
MMKRRKPDLEATHEIEEEDPPPGAARKKAFTTALQQFITLHTSVLGYDKTVKLVSYALPLAAQALRRLQRRDSALAEGLAAIGGHFGMYRVSTRWCGGHFGLPAESANLLTDSWDGGWHAPLIRQCVRLQSWSMIAYYPMEHLAWTATLAPKLFPRLDVKKLSRVSCYFWVFWLLLDILATSLRFRELAMIEKHLTRGGLLSSAHQIALKRSRESLRRYIARILLYLPNALHWTLVDASRWRLPGTVVNILGLSEGLVGSYAFINQDSTSRPKI